MEFVTTAMRRPELLRRTYGTFRSRLRGVDWDAATLYLNVDPAPTHASIDDVVAVAKEFFKIVVVNAPAVCSFPAAVKWCWSQPVGEFFMSIEDDWELLEVVSIDELRRPLLADPGLSCVNLTAYRWPASNVRVCLSPGLFRTDHARAMAAAMVLDANPEQQLREVRPDNPHGGKHHGPSGWDYRGMRFPGHVVLKDIGREWLDASGYRKERDVTFTRWVPTSTAAATPAGMSEAECLQAMKAPGDHRPGIWRGGVLQIKVTNACDLACQNCTAAVGLGRAHNRVWHMSPDQFRTALESLDGYRGVIGMFGGNPCLHPQFADLCEIFRDVVPDQDQRGLWSNRLFGKGEICRQTFSPRHSNLNVHRNQRAYDEMRQTWPEAKILADGLNKPSMHGSWWVAMRDLVPDESERWRLISSCFVNQTWSAEITLINGELRGFFCEWAATRAEYADLLGEPASGVPIEPGWWSRPMEAFAADVRQHCHGCGAPLNPRKVEDLGTDPEEYTASTAGVFLTINGKRPSREVRALEEIAGDAPATKYLPRGVMRAGL